MAITAITLIQREREGFSNLTINTLSLDASYPTGGYSLTPTQLGVGLSVRWVMAAPKNGYFFEYDYANSKLKVFQGDNANAAAAPGIEVANTTSLVAVTGVRVLAYGN
jgi:hypothetical protein